MRDPNLWYEYLITHQDYVQGIFQIQTDVALKNLELYRQVMGDRIEVLVMSGTDFGGQQRPLCSPKLFRTSCGSLSTRAQRLGARAHAVEDLLPLLRRGRARSSTTSSTRASTS